MLLFSCHHIFRKLVLLDTSAQFNRDGSLHNDFQICENNIPDNGEPRSYDQLCFHNVIIAKLFPGRTFLQSGSQKINQRGTIENDIDKSCEIFLQMCGVVQKQFFHKKTANLILSLKQDLYGTGGIMDAGFSLVGKRDRAKEMVGRQTANAGAALRAIRENQPGATHIQRVLFHGIVAAPSLNKNHKQTHGLKCATPEAS